jgi:hypothetical protein
MLTEFPEDRELMKQHRDPRAAQAIEARGIKPAIMVVIYV